MRRRTALGAAIAIIGLAACGGGGSSGKVPARTLTPRLAPPSLVRDHRLQRRFDWSNPVDLVGEGIVLPETTPPSRAVDVLQRAGFEGSAGERLARGLPPNEDDVTIGVVKLASPAAARRTRDWMHVEDSKQPCFAACVFSPRQLPIPGAPSARAVRQVPTRAGSSRATANRALPTHYLMEFTVGPYLYFAHLDDSRRDAPGVIAATELYYRRALRAGP